MPEGHEIDIKKNVHFGVHDGETLTGDYYAPPGTGPYPALVAVHGGGWQLGTAEGYQYWGPYLAHRGYVLLAINYRLVHGPKNRYPAAVHDTRAAVQFLRSQAAALKVDPNRIGCMGESVGARRAAFLEGGSHRRADQLYGCCGPAARALLAGTAVVMPEAGGRRMHNRDGACMTH
jgi:acetyl esterase/lipase